MATICEKAMRGSCGNDGAVARLREALFRDRLNTGKGRPDSFEAGLIISAIIKLGGTP